MRGSQGCRRTWLGSLRAGSAWIAILLVHGWLMAYSADTAEAASRSLYAKEYSISVDATALEPPTHWYVPGVTPIIWSMDPDSSEAYQTTEPRELKLKPGKYQFGTFTFDFPFMVTLEGVLDIAPSLDQCVSGRGTRTLKVVCSRTQPYGGQPEY